MKCRNGLHELDPADPWRASNGARCRECYLAAQDRYNESRKGVARSCRYFERRYYSDKLEDRIWNQKKNLASDIAKRKRARLARHARMEAERQEEAA
jgi:hypothetical protein